MRFIRNINHPDYKIGLYQWNNKFIIKLEAGMFEQTYKIDEYELSSADDIDPCLDPVFLDTIGNRFSEMHRDFMDTLRRNDILF